MIVAATGHRPDKLGGYEKSAIKMVCEVAVVALDDLQPTEVITGMALGWDQAIAVAAIYLEIPFIAAVPFFGQESQWPVKSQMLYHNILSKAKQMKVISKGEYAAWKMHARNNWMIDNCDEVVALYNGTSGGTHECLKYAKDKHKTIHNYWDMYVKHIT